MKSNPPQAQRNFYWLYLAGFFLIVALPLLNLPPWFSPPDWGKTISFRIILSILLFFFIFQKLTNKNNETADSHGLKTGSGGYRLPLYLLLVLLGIYFLATIFSLDIRFSFWGSPYRGGGFLNFAFYIIFSILAFLIIRKESWQKIWDFTILTGIFVSVIAIFQQFGLFSEFFIPSSTRPPSVIGGSIFLAIYLLLLIFPALFFGIKSRSLIKKGFYFISFLLFIFVAIYLTQTRAAFIGLIFGLLWFLFGYPKKLILLKIILGIFLILGIFGFYFLKIHPEVYSNQNEITRNAINRILSINPGAGASRISAWKVSLEAIKDRPILGYGPENFSIGFDKYYDPSLPEIAISPEGITTWWDRAHNFIFDISVTAGIPALIIYISLFGVLLWQLQKLKKDPEKTIVAHGIQATFLAYLVANLFSFDTFSSYLILFLLIGYSLHLLSDQTNVDMPQEKNGFILIKRIYLDTVRWRWPILLFLLIILIWFIWIFNLKPLWINKEIELAIYFSQKKDCENALNEMEKILPTKTYLNSYLNINYVGVIDECIKEKPEMAKSLAPKAIDVLKENIRIQPYNTRNWLLLGSYTNILIEGGREDLKSEANSYFQKAYELSKKRQEVFIEWTKTDLLTGEYQKAKEKAQTCINLNPKPADCWWLKGLSEIYLGENDTAASDIKTAQNNGYPTESKDALLQLAKVYVDLKDYKKLAEIYQKLIALEPNNAQYLAYLADCYKKMGDYKGAREEALKILEIAPEDKNDVEEFLKSLPY